MIKISIPLLVLLSFQFINAQSDSLRINGNLGVRGKWQTGNFAQLVINPNGGVIFEKKQTHIELQANYEFLKVNNGSLINDFWSFGIYQYSSNKTFFPIAMTHYGFAQAYAIDHSLIGGLGIGINVIKKRKHRFLQANIFSGYLNLKYENTPVHKAASIGSYLKLKFPLKKDLIYAMFDSHGYLSLKNGNYHSFNSRMVLMFQIVKNIGVNMTYNLVYNNNNPSVISKTNGKLVFGFNYAFSKIQ